ncbi:MAG: PorT family protein [Chlorobi bacterium]|nr:PorT family protein [Chlorobiota bacterium]
MSDKKHIDRLFQEKLKGFEATPNHSVWENIAAELHSKQKQRKVIPLWWKIAGIAATLLLLFTIGNTLLNNSSVILEETIVNTNSDTKNPIPKNSNKSQTTNLNTINTDTSKNIVSEDLVKNNNSKISNSLLKNYKNNQKNIMSKMPLVKSKNDNSIFAQQTTIPINLQKQSESKKFAVNTQLINSKLNKIVASKNDNATSSNPQKEAITNTLNTETEENKNLSITEVLATVKTNNDENKDSKERSNKWSVTSNIAPVYFNTLGTGSSIHEQFKNNPKTGDVNMSYGISASYAINNRLSVRAGINKVSLGYNTNDVVMYNNIQTTTSNNLIIQNIAFNERGKSLSLLSVDGFNFTRTPSILSNQLNASINQRLGFLEIPIELQYNLSNSKLGVSIIGGVSTLFLNENEIYSEQDGQSTLLGKATNINNTSFTANFGLGFDFKISKVFNFNLEPMFKYQINTFNNTSGNFKPYFIGVYSGLKFKF